MQKIFSGCRCPDACNGMERVPYASWSAIKKLMATPLVLDGRNIYDIKEMEENGFVYHCIGR